MQEKLERKLNVLLNGIFYINTVPWLVSFNIYDKDQDKFIGVQDLSEVLRATLNEHNLVVTPEEVDQIIGL